MTTKHLQDCPIHQGRRCDCGYVEPVASAGNALSEALAALLESYERAQYPSWEKGAPDWHKSVPLARAALASQSTPVAPVVEQAREAHTLAADIKAALKELANGGVFPDLIAAIDRLAALAQSTPHVPAGEPMVDMTPPATQRDRWMYKQGRFAELEDMCALIKAADDAAADSDYMLDSDDCISVLRGTWKGPLTNNYPATPRAPEPAAPVAQEPANYVIPKSVANAFTGKEREAWEHGFKWACSIVQPRVAAPTAAQGLSDAEIDAAAKVIAERMNYPWFHMPKDYPWAHMPKQGRDNMRAIAKDAILSASRAAQETKP